MGIEGRSDQISARPRRGGGRTLPAQAGARELEVGGASGRRLSGVMSDVSRGPRTGPEGGLSSAARRRASGTRMRGSLGGEKRKFLSVIRQLLVGDGRRETGC